MNNTTTSTNDLRATVAMAHAEIRRFTESLDGARRLLDAGVIDLEQALEIVCAHCAAAKLVIQSFTKWQSRGPFGGAA